MGPSFPMLLPSTLASMSMILYTSLHQMSLNVNLSASWSPRGCWWTLVTSMNLETSNASPLATPYHSGYPIDVIPPDPNVPGD
eukprot:817138-Ditylum_brightwellii.AAC.1